MPTLDYLQRVFAREKVAAIEAIDRAQRVLVADFVRRKMTQSGNALAEVADAHVKVFEETGKRMVRITFEAGGGGAGDTVTVETGLTELKGVLSDHLAAFLRQNLWAPRPTLSAAGGRFDEPVSKALIAYVDDFQNGMLGGEKMKKAETGAGAINAIVNSPAAVMHFGNGDVTTNISGSQFRDLTTALHSFMSSPEVAALGDLQREDLARIAASLEAELSAPTPTVAAIRSWGRSLSSIAEQLGVGVAGNALWAMFSGMPR